MRLTARGRSDTGRFFAAARETIGVLFAELQLDVFAGDLSGRDRILRDDAAVVFDFHLDVVVRQYFRAEIENLRESAGVEAMFGVLAEPCLKQASLGAIMQHPAAIDEAFRHM